MIKLIKFSVIAFIGILMFSCEKESIEEGQILERYFLSIDEAVLPIEFRGLDASNTAIVFVHGGPGATGILARQADGLRLLESSYKVVYYDQRGSGVSQGNLDASTMTLEQFTQDLNVVIDFVAQKEGIDQIFLMGQSFGGGLSSYYLSQIKDTRIKGFIAVSPGFELAQSLKLSREWVLNIIETALAVRPTESLRKSKIFYDNNPTINSDNFVDHLRNVEKLGGLKAANNLQITTIKDFNYIPHELAVNLLWVVENLKYQNQSVLLTMNLKEELANITLPTLLLWGEADGLIPVAMADVFKDNIGTNNENFRQKRYPNAAHELYQENAVQVAKDIRDFVEKYN